MRLRKNIFFLEVAGACGLTIESKMNDESLSEATTEQDIKPYHRFLYLARSSPPHSSCDGWVGAHLYWLSRIHRPQATTTNQVTKTNQAPLPTATPNPGLTPSITPSKSSSTSSTKLPTVEIFTGNGVKKTTSFTAPKSWKIVWSC